MKAIFVHINAYAGFPDGLPVIAQYDLNDPGHAEIVKALREGGFHNGIEWVSIIGWAHEYPSVEAALADYPDAA